MKKIALIAAVTVSILFQQTIVFAGTRPRGHKAYVKHSKHHKAHKVHRPHGLIDATYN